jgi:hypothetical protein
VQDWRRGREAVQKHAWTQAHHKANSSRRSPGKIRERNEGRTKVLQRYRVGPCWPALSVLKAGAGFVIALEDDS